MKDGEHMKKFSKKLSALFLAAALTASLTACGNIAPVAETAAESEVVAETTEVTTEESAAVVSETEESEPAAAVETTYPVTLTDSDGNEVILESEPETVVSIAPNLTEMMYALDASDKLIARSDYCDYPEEALSLESVGSLYEPDVEKVLSLQPDLVIVSTHFDDETAQKLADLGVKVLTLYEETDMDGVYTMIETLGEALNKNAEAAAVIEEMQSTIADVEEKVADLDQPSVYYVVGYGEYGDYTATGETFVAQMLEAAGGDNIAKDATGWSITLEEIIEADPDIIIIKEDSKDDFMANENYAELTAVKEGHVYSLDVNMLERQGVRNGEGIKALAEIFHPEAFK